MKRRLEEVLNGKEENYILPFFWQHGESKEEIKEGMRAIWESGIRAVCIESRPHPDFLGPKWWEDMDIIMEEAKARDIKVWVLDDSHFPTGYCNGMVKERSAFSKRYLDHYSVDAIGPMKESSFLLRLEEGEELIGVVAGRRKGAVGNLENLIDITQHVKDGAVYWDVKEGYWQVIVIKSTFNGTGRPNYLNLIEKKAVQFFLDSVYKPHIEHYGKDFKGIFAGFFSDEPELGNCIGEYGHHSVIGTSNMALPWGEELEEILTKKWQSQRNIFLATLWNQVDEISERARYEYMNIVTDLYGKNFCGKVGRWCEEHGVKYIGHVIEDNGTHAHLGLGTGHYFKALWGQHMAGIDVVLQQIRPGYDNMDFYHVNGKGTYNGCFFQYGLAKMGASLGHMDSKKNGRVMCEIYGAYGWSEGLKLMKWLTDHMLVRGVNWFVPHAFTGKMFPDPDCPPHFYGRGKNPQYPWFRYLMYYMNRMCHLLSGGIHIAKIALLYTAEMEWMGEYQPFEEIGRLLATHLLDYEVLPIGIVENCVVEDQMICVGKENYSVLIVPDCKKIPIELAEWISYAAQNNFPVIFAGKIPDFVETKWNQAEYFYDFKERENERKRVERKALLTWPPLNAMDKIGMGEEEKLLKWIDSLPVREIFCDTQNPWLRYYHYRQKEGDFYLFFNEAPIQGIHTAIGIKGDFSGKKACWYDAFDNVLYPVEKNKKGQIKLELSPYQSKLLFIGEGLDENFFMTRRMIGEEKELNGPWEIAFSNDRKKGFKESTIIEKLYNITAADKMPEFSGIIRYRTEFIWEEEEKEAEMDFGTVYETMEVWLNGIKQAVRIAPPYRCRIEGLKNGKNHLEVLVANTLVHALKDPMSSTMPVEGSGLIGPVRIQKLVV